MKSEARYPVGLRPYVTPGAEVLEREPGVWRLQTPAGKAYRLAQLDDYTGLRRGDLRWRPPFQLKLRLRASSAAIPGTWGFGLWNDPFALGMNVRERLLRLPALPNTAWFFHASPPNYLSLRDDLPAQGWLAGAFRSPAWPPGLLALAAPGLALLAIRPAARLLRKLARRFVVQDTVGLDVDVTAWHTYTLDWRPERLTFGVDGRTALATSVSPRPPLGAVIWLDNQYMRFEANGRLGFGVLEAGGEDWIELGEVEVG